ncbi:MAG: hypothetical protein AAF901_04355 [Bacteroidota bacterium]
MLIKRVFKVVLVLLAILFLVFSTLRDEVSASGVSAVALVLLTFLYCRLSTGKRERYFFLFLTTFMVAQLVNFIGWFVELSDENAIDYAYYVSNSLYILSYLFLIIKVIRYMNLRLIVSKFSIPIFILLVLDIFCVYIVTASAVSDLGTGEYILEFIYNAVIMFLLSVALISYMYRNDNKSMLFLVGSILIVFSEMIQLTYFYVSDANNLNIIYSVFLVLGFLFFYLQSQAEYTGPVESYTEDQLKA